MDTQLQESIRTSDYVNACERAGAETNRGSDTNGTALFEPGEAAQLRARWEKIQVEFVDEPRKSVEQADELVANVAQRLTEMFANQKDRLERDWDKGEISTEELRTAFRRYRALFDRLLSI